MSGNVVNTNLWNEVIDLWNTTNLYWNLIVEVLKGGRASDDYLTPDKKDKKLQEEFIKVYITVYNSFLTEEQKRFFKISQSYPTYKEKFKILKTEKVILKEYKLQTGVDLKSTINVVDIKIGLNKIEEHVRNRTKK